MRRALTVALLCCALAVSVEAQSPDCRLADRRFDNPFSDRAGWVMRRYQWTAFYALLSTGAAEGIHRVAHLPRWASALTASVVIGYGPHVRGLLQHRYPLDWKDVAADGFTRSAPLILWTGVSGGTWQSKTLAATTYAGGYLAGACYAHP